MSSWAATSLPFDVMANSPSPRGFHAYGKLAINPSLAPQRVHIVDAKLDPTMLAELHSLVTEVPSASPSHSSLLSLEDWPDAHTADVIVTAVKTPKRLQRHINLTAVGYTDSDIQVDVSTSVMQNHTPIVTPLWLQQSVREGRLLPFKDFSVLDDKHRNDSNDGEGQVGLPNLPATGVNRVLNSSPRLPHTARYACSRASPLVCVNQKLLEQFDVLRKSRALESLNVNALAYERVIAVLKAYPYLITSENFADITNLPFLGDKTKSKIREFLELGYIPESRSVAESARYQALSAFTTVYGIGPATARNLYDLGLRTMSDLERYYDVNPADDASIPPPPIAESTPGDKKSKLPLLDIKAALLLRDDLSKPMPRESGEELRAIICQELETILPGCRSVIVGGYRRGKPEINDLDIVFGHSNLKSGGDQVQSLCESLVRRLYTLGYVKFVMRLPDFSTPNTLRTSHKGCLESATVVFRLPVTDARKVPSHHQVDLIFAADESFWTAVVGWTGSRMFERDLRLWAKNEKAMKFDSTGLIRRYNSQHLYPKSEEEVFSMLGLEWVDPTLRNADA